MSANLLASQTNPIAYQHYRDLPADLYRESKPTPSLAPSLIELNQGLLDQLDIDATWFRNEQALSVMAGNAINNDNPPIAMAYSGHQFGQWAPLLGDGRAHMLGQMVAADSSMIDVQLKGSGRTPFSRGGDGRASLGAVLREYVVSEAMAGLGIPTTRSIAMLGTGEFARFVAILTVMKCGYHTVRFRGRRYGVTVHRSSDGRATKLFERELGSSDIVSCNLFLVRNRRPVLRPCEMSPEKVMRFLLEFEVDEATSGRNGNIVASA